MLKVFNKAALTRKQRFSRALLVGGVVMALLTAIMVLIILHYGIYIEIVLAGIGFCIGYSIQYYGKGVQIQFSILAAVLTVISILICDFCAYGGLGGILEIMSYDFISIIIRVAAVVLAYRYARII